MTAANQLISELVRAANGIEKLSDDDRRRLFHRAVVIMRDLGQAAMVPDEAMQAVDTITQLQVVVAELAATAKRPNEVSECMLLAATMIRDLQIELSRG